MTTNTVPRPHDSAASAIDRISRALEENRQDLIALSHSIHADPELSGQEFRAARRISDYLQAAGLSLEETPEGLPTAFRARAGSADFRVALCVEYDALPEIGHGCGHNVNAAVSVGAAVALLPLLDELGISLTVLGTPAEETFGGKVDLLRQGYFDDADLAMMAHAAPWDLVGSSSLALNLWDVTYTGKSAHAAAGPEHGVNALDALLIAQTAIGLARQQLPPGSIVSTITLEGGSAINMIPATTRAQVEMRSRTLDGLRLIQSRVRRCLEAGAVASGCELTVAASGNEFADLRQDRFLCEQYQAAMALRGREVEISSAALASTDMGNVSHHVPAIHPLIGFEADGAAMHTAEFTAACITPGADAAIIDGAFGLAATAVAAALNRERLGAG